ncbi:MAG TPA: alpha-1,4-glucan--maltose-1-phosphate maltosyltransferase [Usitatibacter sp.]|nr:alpha-1,4-glucan--maltose-1-phosphate maltosyltransferase [Usitatibacter sp.]
MKAAVRQEAAAAPAAAHEPAPAFAVVEEVSPQVEGGRFAIKRVVGEDVVVTAACYAHGHEVVRCVVRYRGPGGAWREAPMEPLGNDLWRGEFTVDRVGPWEYSVACWVDHLTEWRDGFARRVDADDIRLAARVGAELIARSAALCSRDDCERLEPWSRILREEHDLERLRLTAMDETLFQLALANAPRDGLSASPAYPVTVDRERARFSTWYELFPRSCASKAGVHGTFADVDERLDYVASMGFDVLYLPPIHPIGREKRKGKNNATVAQEGDVGSPWAIGSKEGGHSAILPELGTLNDFKHLLMAARARGMEIAMDIAFQCAPDHPWVTEHPGWFRKRPDGSIQYAENPPKKYQDIYPLDFDSSDWRGLWSALRDVFLFWIEQGVCIFRVDNPHTKPFAFWEWCIAAIKRDHPEVLFLSEAFTRPHVMHRLARLGFTQSYTYYTWRTSKQEIIEYFTELTQSASREYFRPNCWPNTPDILPYHLQNAGLAMFRIRLVLAATLAANYGMYGPAFELGENRPREPGSEEYLDSEKYQLRHWDLQRPDSLAPLITRLNRLRREHPAMQSDWSLAFHATDNDALIAYSKRQGDDRVLVVVNLDPHHIQSGFVTVDLAALGLDVGVAYEVRDALGGTSYTWYGGRNFVSLDPQRAPAHVFTLA